MGSRGYLPGGLRVRLNTQPSLALRLRMNGSIPPLLNSGDMHVLSLIYSYVAVCMFCAIRCLIIICFYWLFYYYSTYVFSILFMCVFLFVGLFSILCILCFLYCFSYCIYYSPFPVFAQVYRPLPPGRNPTAVNKYHHQHLLMACAGTC